MGCRGPRKIQKGGYFSPKGGSNPGGKGGSKSGGKGGRGLRKWGILALKTLKSRGSSDGPTHAWAAACRVCMTHT